MQVFIPKMLPGAWSNPPLRQVEVEPSRKILSRQEYLDLLALKVDSLADEAGPEEIGRLLPELSLRPGEVGQTLAELMYEPIMMDVDPDQFPVTLSPNSLKTINPEEQDPISLQDWLAAATPSETT